MTHCKKKHTVALALGDRMPREEKLRLLFNLNSIQIQNYNPVMTVTYELPSFFFLMNLKEFELTVALLAPAILP